MDSAGGIFNCGNNEDSRDSGIDVVFSVGVRLSNKSTSQCVVIRDDEGIETKGDSPVNDWKC